MKTLERVLRVRALLEETSRMELEKRVKVLERLENAMASERRSLQESREALFRVLTDVPSADASLMDEALQRGEERIFAEAAGEVARWREQRLMPLVVGEGRKMAGAREEFLERRKERRQVETVLDAVTAREGVERLRREQRDLDAWFSQRQAQGARGRLRRPVLASSSDLET
jgi:hypothetical protein